MPFWKPSERVTLASLENGTKFRLCRNGLRYKLIDKSYSKARARVKAVGHQTGVVGFSESIPPTLNKNSLVVPIS
ncbi:hypothetical protein AB9M41_004655 [Vibrio alginolyticus]